MADTWAASGTGLTHRRTFEDLPRPVACTFEDLPQFGACTFHDLPNIEVHESDRFDNEASHEHGNEGGEDDQEKDIDKPVGPNGVLVIDENDLSISMLPPAGWSGYYRRTSAPELPRRAVPSFDDVITEEEAQQQRQAIYQERRKTQRLSLEDLDRFTNFERQKVVTFQKPPNASLGLLIAECTQASFIPSVLIASIYPNSAAARCGELCVGDVILSVNHQSLVGLPYDTVLDKLRALSKETTVHMVVVPADPVLQVRINRDHSTDGRLGFGLYQNEIVNVEEGSPADIAGLRTGYRITEVNGVSVVGAPQEMIFEALQAQEVCLKTMPRDLYNCLVCP